MITAERIALWIAAVCFIALVAVHTYWSIERHLDEDPPITVSYVPAKYEGMADRLYLDREGEIVCCIEDGKE